MRTSILELYDADFYELDPSGVTSRLFRAIPAQLNTNASRYQVSGVIEGSRVDRLDKQLMILKDSMTVNIAFHSNDPNAGLALHINPDQFKLFCCDTGLFVPLAFWDSEFTDNTNYQKLLSDNLPTDLGYVFENVVAQMLVAAGQKLYYHTWPTPQGNRNYEIDFLISRGSKICPIEIKSSRSNAHTSIDEFQKKFSNRILHRYLVYTKNMRKDKDLLCLPVYMVPFL